MRRIHCAGCIIWNCKNTPLFSGHYLRKFSTLVIGDFVIPIYFNIRNTLPKSRTFILGHPLYVSIEQFKHSKDKFFRLCDLKGMTKRVMGVTTPNCTWSPSEEPLSQTLRKATPLPRNLKLTFSQLPIHCPLPIGPLNSSSRLVNYLKRSY